MKKKIWRSLVSFVSICALLATTLVIFSFGGNAAVSMTMPEIPKDSVNRAGTPAGNNGSYVAHWVNPPYFTQYSDKTHWLDFPLTDIQSADAYVLQADITFGDFAEWQDETYTGIGLIFRSSADKEYKFTIQKTYTYAFIGDAAGDANKGGGWFTYERDTTYALTCHVTPTGAALFIDGKYIAGLDGDADFAAATPMFRFFGQNRYTTIANARAYSLTSPALSAVAGGIPEKNGPNLTGTPDGDKDGYCVTWAGYYTLQNTPWYAHFTYPLNGVTAEDTYVIKTKLTVKNPADNSKYGARIAFRSGSDGKDEVTYYVALRNNNISLMCYCQNWFARDEKLADIPGCTVGAEEEVALVCSPDRVDVYLDGTLAATINTAGFYSWDKTQPVFWICGGENAETWPTIGSEEAYKVVKAVGGETYTEGDWNLPAGDTALAFDADGGVTVTDGKITSLNRTFDLTKDLDVTLKLNVNGLTAGDPTSLMNIYLASTGINDARFPDGTLFAAGSFYRRSDTTLAYKNTRHSAVSTGSGPSYAGTVETDAAYTGTSSLVNPDEVTLRIVYNAASHQGLWIMENQPATWDDNNAAARIGGYFEAVGSSAYLGFGAENGSISVKSVNGVRTLADIPTLSILGAQLRDRSDDKSDMRFGTSLRDKSWYVGNPAVSEVQYGTLIIPTAYLGLGELNKDTDRVLDIPAVKWQDPYIDEATSESRDLFTAVLTDIPASQINTSISARSYIRFKYDDVDYILYTPVIKRSVYQVQNDLAPERELIPMESKQSLGIPDSVVAESVYNEGNLARLKAVMQKAENGDDITVGVIGGSITDGSNVPAGKNYATLVHNWWLNTFPSAKINFVNAGVGSTGSQIGVHRVDDDLLAYDPDFVILEFAVNDGVDNAGVRESYEGLIRKILQSNHHPALMLLFMCQSGGGIGAQEAHAAVGMPYDLPMISYRDACCMAVNEQQLFNWGKLTTDGVHPNEFGYAVCGMLINEYLTSVYNRLDSITGTENELPAAAYGDIYANTSVLTNLNTTPTSLGTAVADTNGIYFMPKVGWSVQGNEPLTFTVNARRITLLYRRDATVQRNSVTVDANGSITQLDGYAPEYWDNLPTTAIVYDSDTTDSVTLSLSVNEAREAGFNLSAVYIAY